MRTYWLSFANDAGFLGACIVEVDEPDPDTSCLCSECKKTPEHPWLVAAVRAAHKAGINPGGEVLAARLDHIPEEFEKVKTWPRLKLFNKDEVIALGCIKNGEVEH